MDNPQREVTLQDLIGMLWDARKFFVRTAILSAALGVFIALTTPEEWQAPAKVFIESENELGLSGSFGDLASLAGISLPSASTGAINPYAFEDIMKSDAFIRELLNQNFSLSSCKDSISFQLYCDEYLRKNWKDKLISAPAAFLKLFRSEEDSKESQWPFITLTKKEEKLYEKLRRRLFFLYDDEKGIVSMGMVIQDPFLSAQIGAFMIKYLLTYSEKHVRTLNEKKLSFISTQLAEKEKRFLHAQQNLASFRDQNLLLATNIAKNKEKRLQNEFNLALSLYSELSQNYEAAKIALEEKSPVIQPMGPITVPAKASAPNKPLLVLGFISIGLIMAIFYHLVHLRISEKK